MCLIFADTADNKSYMMDYTVVDDEDSNPPSRPATPDVGGAKSTTMAKLVFSTTKVPTAPLFDGDLIDSLCTVVSLIFIGH